MKHKTVAGRIFDVCNYMFLLLIVLCTLYPFWDLFVVSFMDLKQYMDSVLHLFPSRIVLDSYKATLGLGMLWRSYGNTLFVTVVGTFINMFLTTIGGFALSRENIRGQRLFMFLITFTMIFNGGLIPNYILVKSLHMMNTLWAVMIPTAISTYNLILMKTFFNSIPRELEESSKIDGANEAIVLFRIFLPLSMPAVATLSLFYAVANWNQFFLPVLYLTDKKLYTLQMFLRTMLFESEAIYMLGGDSVALLGQPFKAAIIMITTIPMILVYPFFQKYFTQGIMLGAVKG